LYRHRFERRKSGGCRVGARHEVEVVGIGLDEPEERANLFADTGSDGGIDPCFEVIERQRCVLDGAAESR
jgi:hypothetical protein